MQQGAVVDLQHVTAHARERLGMEIQAVELLHTPPAGSRTPEVWSLLTEHGDFWLVERAGQVEIFRATFGGQPATLATKRFLELHPGASDLSAYDCRACGTRVILRRRGRWAARKLCARCAHAENQRERYYSDPAYRARALAASATRYERRRGQGSP